MLITVDCSLATLAIKLDGQMNGCSPGVSMSVSAHVACCAGSGGGEGGEGDTPSGYSRKRNNMRDTERQTSTAIAVIGLSARSCHRKIMVNLRLAAVVLPLGRSKQEAQGLLGCLFCLVEHIADYKHVRRDFKHVAQW
jgi:hypothetical protein